NNLRIGVVDHSRSAESRELVAYLTSNRVFQMTGYVGATEDLQRRMDRGDLDVGLVVPVDYHQLRAEQRPARLQLLLNAVNANTATIAEGYTRAMVAAYNGHRPTIQTRVALLFNPGLVGSWFIVTGTFGVLLVLNGSIVAANSMIKEKESGTVEHLLMTPANSTEIIAAKIAPLFLLLLVMTTVVLIAVKIAFDVPFRGNLLVFYLAAALCLLTGIAIGTILATFASSAQQAQLLALFINPPLATLSGALTPIEAMPEWLQPVTIVNPVRHFAAVARGVMIKGSGGEELLVNFAALALFGLALLGISVWRFRRQLK
ncbi:MAG TPA: ABC transporter permease, partial [Bryobacteraceae bacterium]|nr:ABC transporter permease [Bryobacteraceae bacterium]